MEIQAIPNSNIGQHYALLLASFQAQFVKTQEGLGVEDIHQLRVSIKKLRAVLALMEIVTRGQFLKQPHYTLFKPLFKKAGAVREAQVNLALLQNYQNRSSLRFKKHLETIILQGNEDLLVELKNFDPVCLEILNESLFQQMDALPTETIQQESVAFIEAKLKKIQFLQKDLSNDRKLHKIRILLKEVHEILTLLEKLDPAHKSPKLLKAVTKLNKLIGDWHDYTVLAGSLKTFRLDLKAKKKIRGMKKLRKEIVLLNKKRRKKIQGRLEAVLEIPL